MNRILGRTNIGEIVTLELRKFELAFWFFCTFSALDKPLSAIEILSPVSIKSRCSTYLDIIVLFMVCFKSRTGRTFLSQPTDKTVNRTPGRSSKNEISKDTHTMYGIHRSEQKANEKRDVDESIVPSRIGLK